MQPLDHFPCEDVLIVVRRQVDTGLQRSVGIIGIDEGGLGKHGVHVDLVAVVGVVVGQGRERYGEPVADLLVYASVHRQTAVRLGGNNRLVLVIGHSETVASAPGASRDAEIVALGDSGAVEQVLPVGIYRIVLVERVLVDTGHFAHADILVTRHHRIFDGLLGRGIHVERHLRRLSLHALVGRDEYYAVTASRAVDCRGGGVLEDVHALYVARRDVGKASHERDSVQYNQRVVGCRQRALSAYPYLHRRTGTRRSLHHLHTGNAAVQRPGNVGRGNRPQGLAAYGGYGTRHIGPAGRTVADDHRTFESLKILQQGDIDHVAPAYRNRNGLEAHALHLQDRTLRNGKRISSVQIGARSVLRVLLQYKHSYYGLTVLIGDSSSHGARLGEDRCRQTCRTQENTQKLL